VFSEHEIVSLGQNLINVFQEELKSSGISPQKKIDDTWVTNIDLKISDYLKEYNKKHSSQFHCLSEEEEEVQIKFPLMIVDPIDGTRELTEGKKEISISIAWMNSASVADSMNQALIINPFNDHRSLLSTKTTTPRQEVILKGFVSNSEWKNKLYQNWNSKSFILEPHGSIAYKLSLLYQRECDFVVSLKPKSIWDIAAGCVLNESIGNVFYEGKKKITSLDKMKFNPPLFWGNEKTFQHLVSLGLLS
jgi:myo-inositol-1(or 4)-monophosphatase